MYNFSNILKWHSNFDIILIFLSIYSNNYSKKTVGLMQQKFLTKFRDTMFTFEFVVDKLFNNCIEFILFRFIYYIMYYY